MSTPVPAWPNRLRHWLRGRGIFIVLALVFGAAVLVSDAFLQPKYLFNVVRQVAPVGIAAIGVTYVMILGGVDLSVGAVISLTAVVCAVQMDGDPDNIARALFVACLTGTTIGALNGLAVAFARVSPFIMTLGMGVAVLGLTQIFSGGTARGVVSPGFREWMNFRWFDIVPGLAFCFLGLAVTGLILQKTTVFGRHLFLIGSNEAAARLAGVPIARTTLTAYALSGFFGSLAGVALLARSGVSSTSAGQGLEFQVLAAVVLGGTTFKGGRGGIAGTVAGVLVLVLAFNLVNMSGLPYHMQLVVMGLIIITASSLYQKLEGPL